MVEGRGHLNQGLQKALLRFIEGEPDALPMLMGDEEFASPVAGEAFGERTLIPIEKHVEQDKRFG